MHLNDTSLVTVLIDSITIYSFEIWIKNIILLH